MVLGSRVLVPELSLVGTRAQNPSKPTGPQMCLGKFRAQHDVEFNALVNRPMDGWALQRREECTAAEGPHQPSGVTEVVELC